MIHVGPATFDTPHSLPLVATASAVLDLLQWMRVNGHGAPSPFEISAVLDRDVMHALEQLKRADLIDWRHDAPVILTAKGLAI